MITVSQRATVFKDVLMHPRSSCRKQMKLIRRVGRNISAGLAGKQLRLRARRQHEEACLGTWARRTHDEAHCWISEAL